MQIEEMKRTVLALVLFLTVAFAVVQAKTLVVYYSYTGNCKAIAGELANQMTADVLEIQPKEKGLKYEANNYALGTQLLNAINANPNNANSYPAIDPVKVSLDGYQNIIIITPLWWSQMAAPMQTFLFQYGSQMADKNIGLIVSSASSGINRVEADCKRLVPNGNYFSESLWIRSSQVRNAASLISDWLQQISFTDSSASDNVMIKISDGVNSITYELNQTSAALSLYEMLPLEVTVQNYGNNEKIFYPSTAVSYGADCIEEDCPAGTLALFSPWGNIVMYYGPANRYSGLYILGKAVEGADKISSLSGTIRVEAIEGSSAIQTTKADNGDLLSKAYTLFGMIATEGQAGIIIKNGKKVLVK